MFVVWEGLIATCDNPAKFDWFMNTRRPGRAVALFKTNQLAVSAMWQAMLHGVHGVSVVTFLPERLWGLVQDRVESDVVPCRDFLGTTPAELVRRLPHMPWVSAIADPELYRSRAYGSYGRHVPAEHPELIGRLW